MDLITRSDDERLDIKKNPFYPVNSAGIHAAYQDVMMLRDSLRAALERERWHVKLEARVYCANHLPTAKESQITQPCPWCEVMRVYEERIALRADLAAALLRAEEAERKLCAAREAYHSLRMSATGMSSESIIPHHAVQTRLLDLMSEALGWPDFNSSSPCRHAAEADAMREALSGP
jgi:hypothetical protein